MCNEMGPSVIVKSRIDIALEKMSLKMGQQVIQTVCSSCDPRNALNDI